VSWPPAWETRFILKHARVSLKIELLKAIGYLQCLSLHVTPHLLARYHVTNSVHVNTEGHRDMKMGKLYVTSHVRKTSPHFATWQIRGRNQERAQSLYSWVLEKSCPIGYGLIKSKAWNLHKPQGTTKANIEYTFFFPKRLCF